jgi:hypothetical protein
MAIAADVAEFSLAESTAAATVSYGVHRLGQNSRQLTPTLPVVLEQMIGHALGALGADSRETTQCRHELVQ